MRLLLALLPTLLLPVSCSSYRITSLDVKFGSGKPTIYGERVDLSPVMPYLKRATWSNDRMIFTTWKTWDTVTFSDGTELMIKAREEGFSSFRIKDVKGEYRIRDEDNEKFAAAMEEVKR